MFRYILLTYLRWRLDRVQKKRDTIPWNPDWRKVEENLAVEAAMLRHRIESLTP